MKKLIQRTFVISSVILLVALACGRARQIAPTEIAPTEIPPETEDQTEEQAQSEGPSLAQEGDILFQDDFQDGQSDGWDITAAWDVQQAGDTYTFEAGGEGGAWVPEGNTWSNYAYQASARLDAGSLLFGFNLNQDGRYFVRLDENGVYLIKESPAKNYTPVVQTGPVSLGEWHQLDMRAYDGHIQVYVDEQLWVDYSDNVPLSHGTISLTALDGSQVAVDDVLVTKTGPLPAGVVQAPPPLEGQADLDMAEVDDGIELEEVAEEDGEEVEQQEGEQGEEQQQEGDQEELPSSGEPDLVVIEATFDPDPVIQGQPFTANYMIENQGDVPTGAFTLLWKFHDATGVGVCSWDYDSLDAGQTAWGACTKTTNAQAGQSPTTLTVDFEDEVAESNENNNQLSPTLVVAAPEGDGGDGEEQDEEEPQSEALPNLRITNVYFQPDPVIIGQPFTVHYTIENQSDVDCENDFTVEVVFHEEAGIRGCTDEYGGLRRGINSLATCTRTTNAQPGGYITRFSVDVDNDIAESDESDNTVTATLTLRRE